MDEATTRASGLRRRLVRGLLATVIAAGGVGLVPGTALAMPCADCNAPSGNGWSVEETGGNGFEVSGFPSIPLGERPEHPRIVTVLEPNENPADIGPCAPGQVWKGTLVRYRDGDVLSAVPVCA
ncbi:hypothetical protein [Actinomycetospora termitidis]|uniref:Secreted protein n=1 Tax=Actinomycetospora termitidis TaxID=3053470 RepID=A0ABT7M9K5_9PSEU|nr:hypothetical protein [Actinomycetospora sp. Odt1-22]MDL5157354.1 hypothetical protein [Actinomycetospora sp. Odt1-22]